MDILIGKIKTMLVTKALYNKEGGLICNWCRDKIINIKQGKNRTRFCTETCCKLYFNKKSLKEKKYKKFREKKYRKHTINLKKDTDVGTLKSKHREKYCHQNGIVCKIYDKCLDNHLYEGKDDKPFTKYIDSDASCYKLGKPIKLDVRMPSSLGGICGNRNWNNS